MARARVIMPATYFFKETSIMPTLSTTVQAAVALAEQIQRAPLSAPRMAAFEEWEWLPEWLGPEIYGPDHDRRGWGKKLITTTASA